MDISVVWPWMSLVALGLFHGVNPAMGWLFAVALGLQERRRSAVLQALLPIALGHEAAIAVVVVLVGGLQAVGLSDVVRVVGAVLLVAFGAFKLWRPLSHPRWVGLRVTRGELALWSFLMSSAHGAGLMLFPVLMGLGSPGGSGEQAAVPAMPTLATIVQDGAAVFLHTASMLVAMGAIALLVYDRLGLGVLRRTWLNVDRLWATAILMAGLLTLFT